MEDLKAPVNVTPEETDVEKEARKTTSVSVQVDESINKRIQNASLVLGRPRTEILRTAILNHLCDLEEGEMRREVEAKIESLKALLPAAKLQAVS